MAGLRIGTGDAVRKNWTAGCIARTRGKDGDAGESFSQDGLGMAAESLGVSLAPDTGSATKSFPWPSWRQCGTIHVLYVLSHGYGYLEEHA